MNVVMVGPFGLRPKGTVSVRALPMAGALSGRGHAVTLLVPPWDHPADAGREWVEDGVRVENCALPPRLPLLFHALLTLRLVRRAVALSPDVVHCFKPKAYSGLAHFVLWWLRRLGLINRGLRLVVDADDWERAWNEVESYSPFQRAFFSWQERWGLCHADAVVVASRELADLVVAEEVPCDRVFYVPNGVRPGVTYGPTYTQPAARTLRGLDDAPVVLLYSRFVEFKLERIVTIMQQVMARQPGVRLLVVGEGLSGEEEDLADMLTAAGLGDSAVFTGWGRPERLQGHFAVADVAIFPYDDTLINRTKCSVRLIDLLAAGVAVVADAVGQNQEYIIDGETGVLVSAEDDMAFGDAVVRLLADAGQRSHLGMAAARRVREDFGWPKLAARVEDAYR
jgi:glycosyltransferase involved in cell wall biosynthesis